jgi:hypothetical protein
MLARFVAALLTGSDGGGGHRGTLADVSPVAMREAA